MIIPLRDRQNDILPDLFLFHFPLRYLLSGTGALGGRCESILPAVQFYVAMIANPHSSYYAIAILAGQTARQFCFHPSLLILPEPPQTNPRRQSR